MTSIRYGSSWSLQFSRSLITTEACYGGRGGESIIIVNVHGILKAVWSSWLSNLKDRNPINWSCKENLSQVEARFDHLAFIQYMMASKLLIEFSFENVVLQIKDDNPSSEIKKMRML